jgi:hypothetical protein
LRSNGHLDLLGLSAEGQPVQGLNQSSKNYHWQVVRPHAVQAVGDQRINPFGVGGEIEIRSGLLVQKQPIKVRNFISDWASRPKLKWCGSSGPMARCAPSLA